jgi:hypothetical protein
MSKSIQVIEIIELLSHDIVISSILFFESDEEPQGKREKEEENNLNKCRKINIHEYKNLIYSLLLLIKLVFMTVLVIYVRVTTQYKTAKG